jgi:hypothetical protein
MFCLRTGISLHPPEGLALKRRTPIFWVVSPLPIRRTFFSQEMQLVPAEWMAFLQLVSALQEGVIER